jgi:hypothetical protein
MYIPAPRQYTYMYTDEEQLCIYIYVYMYVSSVARSRATKKSLETKNRGLRPSLFLEVTYYCLVFFFWLSAARAARALRLKGLLAPAEGEKKRTRTPPDNRRERGAERERGEGGGGMSRSRGGGHAAAGATCGDPGARRNAGAQRPLRYANEATPN